MKLFKLSFPLLAKLCFLLSLMSMTGLAYAGTKGLSVSDLRPILISETIPDVTLLNNEGEKVSLHGLVKTAPTLFVFYRGGWCPYCNTHLSDLRKIESELKEMGVQIVAVSPDTVENLNKTVDKNTLDYTLLSDTKMEASKAFGLAYKVDDETMSMLKGYGIDLEKKLWRKSWFVTCAGSHSCKR